jgi:NodT family efflux transporter outer membrane factor (OMF) lipoprotein
MRFRKTKIFGAIIVGLAACLPIPKQDLPQQDLSCNLDNSVAEALGDGTFQFGAFPRKQWWKEFGDPILNKLEESALKLSPTLKRVEERLRAAKEVVTEKKSKLYPELNFDADTDYEHFSKYGFFRELAPTVPAVINDITMNLSFTYEFDFWGKNRALIHAAMGTVAAMNAERLQAELILTTSIAYSYAELQYLLCRQKILEQKEENLKTILLIRAKREKYALDTIMESLNARSEVLDIQAKVLEVSQQIKLQIHRLKALSGLGQDATLAIEFKPLDPLRVFIPEKLSLDLISRRPDLIAQKARVEAASFQVGAAKTLFYPNINLSAIAGVESIHWNKLLKIASFDGSLEPAIHLPIFTAGRLRAQWKEKIADFNEAVFGYNELILQAANEIADQLTNISALQKEIGVRQISLEIASELERVLKRRVEHALDDRIGLLKAKNNVLDMELICAELEVGKQIANVLLIRGLGGGLYD